jgi:hypothetical protein
MADNFTTLTNRLQNRCPAVGIVLAGQLVNDAWHQFQARREWSFRRRSGTFSPPVVYSVGAASTAAALGYPNLISGTGNWTPQMVGLQIRIGGPLYPFYTISQYLSPGQILIDQPWAGPDVLSQQYQILRTYYSVPADFNYFHVVVSTQNNQRLWTSVTQNELAVLDPQRTNQGTAFATAFRDFTVNYSGVIGPVIPVTSPTGPAPISTTTFGYSYPADASYVVQVVSGGTVGTATFQWLRAGQQSFQPIQITSGSVQDLSDGVQVYWPAGTYVAGDSFIINCKSQVTQSAPRYELWPSPTPTGAGSVYPYIYIAKEYDINAENPTLPPFVANRGDVILEMALAACARFPGQDSEHPNVYFNLELASLHETRADKFIAELATADEEVSVSNRNYENYPMAPAPWTIRPRPALISGSTGGDDFNTLSNRLLDRCPAIGIQLAEQMINDSWHALQARKDWSWRRKSGTFAPPTLYSAGWVSTNVANGNPNLITGTGTEWTPSMIGSQIRAGGLLFPYYTITGWLSANQILIDQPWAGEDVSVVAYQILQVYYPVPADFGYFEVAVSIKDGYRLWTQATEYELAMLDPQRTNQGQTYAIAFYDFTNNLGGIIGPVNSVTSPTDPAPVSVTTLGYTYPDSAVYIIQVVTGGPAGVATFQWMRAGQLVFSLPVVTSTTPQDLADGVQVYWPSGTGPTWQELPIPWEDDNNTWGSPLIYVAGDVFTINAESILTSGVARYELWPAPSFNGYLYPFIYFVKETDLTAQNPILPPPIANRGEIILEMALEKCATYPGADMDHPNPYFSLQLANYHRERYENLIVDLEVNDENIGITRLTYEDWPFAGPWNDGHWQATHAPFLSF